MIDIEVDIVRILLNDAPIEESNEGLPGVIIDVRYPGESADEATARAAVAHGRTVRSAIRQSLNLPSA